jgi:glycine/D-amino acid oxidase-like deaminating enzyme/nitrite reductase/ring-hydroxylating ferredoxin subunit
MARGTRAVWAETTDPVRYPALYRSEAADVCVIGAGQAGLATAYSLAQEGVRVVLLEKSQPGMGETGRSSAHLTSWLDDGNDLIVREHGVERARQVARSHADAIAWIEAVATGAGIECGFRRIPAYLFSVHEDRLERLGREQQASAAAGLSAHLDERPVHDPFGHGLALRIDDQAACNPLRFLHGLARAAVSAGVAIHGNTFVTAVKSAGDGVSVETRDGGIVRAGACVVATNASIADHVTTHTKQAPYRTYVTTFAVEPGAIPDAMYFDDEDPYHYCRVVREADRELLLVGGEDHKTGQADDGRDRLARLEAWARAWFPQAGDRMHAWSGQVFEPADALGLNGRDPGTDHVYMISGDSGDGLTNGVVGALLVTDLIMGRANPLADVYDPGRRPKSLKQFARENLNVAKVFAFDRLAAGMGSSTADLPAGSGRVIRRRGGPVAAYRAADGSLHECSALCTHLGCVVHWNSLESSWDCPCHGSRFDPYGDVITGPAASALTPPAPTDDD